MLKDLFKKALGHNDSEPFQDLVQKAYGKKKTQTPSADETIGKPSFLTQKTDNAPATPAAPKPAAPPAVGKKPKTKKLAMPQGSPANAEIKTNIQMDSSTTPVEKVVLSGKKGAHTKTVHQGTEAPKPNTGLPNGAAAAPKVPKVTNIADKQPQQSSLFNEPEQPTQPEAPRGEVKTKQTIPQVHDTSEMHPYISGDNLMIEFAKQAKAGNKINDEDLTGVVEVLAAHGDPKAKKLLKQVKQDEGQQSALNTYAYNALGVDEPEEEKPALVVPVGEQPPKQIDPSLAPTAAHAEHTQNTQLVQHPDGGQVATGHPAGSIPNAPVLDHKGKFYHDLIQEGHTVSYNAWAGPHYGWREFQGKVVAKNPDGHQILHVEHPSAAKREAGELLPVHYSKLNHVMVPDSQNPHEHKIIKYNGEHTTPKQSDPQGATPQPKHSPKDAAEYMEKHKNLMKIKGDAIKPHLQNGDYVEFWIDGGNGVPKLERGHVTALPTVGDDKGGKKPQQTKDGKKVEPTAVTVMTAKGIPISVPFHFVHRFAKHVVNNHHFFQFDDKTGTWENESVQRHLPEEKEQTGELPQMHSGIPQSASASGMATTPAAAGSQQQQKEVQDGVPHNGVEHHELNPTNDIDEKEVANIIFDAGGKFIASNKDKGIVYMENPETGAVHKIPMHDVSTLKIKEILEGKKPKPEEFHKEHMAQQPEEFDVKSHWTHRLGEKAVAHARSLLDKLDKVRQGQNVPPAILAARSKLLHGSNELDALDATSLIHEYLDSPHSFHAHSEYKPPTADDFKSHFGTTNLGEVDGNHAFDTLVEKKPINSYQSRTFQNAADNLLDAYAKLDGQTGDFANSTDPEIPALIQKIKDGLKFSNNDNRNYDYGKLLHFVRERLEEKAKAKGVTLPDLKHIMIPHKGHAELSDHADRMADMIDKHGLHNPYIGRLIHQLHGVMEFAPDSPLAEKLHNELANYAYEAGEQHPAMMHTNLLKNLAEGKAKLPPEIQHNIEEREKQVATGQLNPEQAWSATAQDMLENGIDIAKVLGDKAPHLSGQPVATRSDAAKMSLDNMIAGRKTLAESQKVGEQLNDMVKQHEEQPLAVEEATAAQNKKGASMPGVNPEEAEFQKNQAQLHDVTKKLMALENTIIDYEDMLTAQHGGNPQEQATLHNMKQKFSENYAKYEELVNTLQEKHGATVTPWVSKLKTQAAKEQNESSKHISEQHEHFENYAREWMAQELAHKRNSISVERQHFLSRMSSQSPQVQEELKAIDKLVKEKMDSNDWSSIDPNQFVSPMAHQFAHALNNHIEDIRDREKMTGIPLSQALEMEAEMFGKSLTDVIVAEKTLMRRDVSLALRKSFYNDKESPELRKATELMASYFDDFINTVMTNYKHIPIALRKSITRKLLKGLINDIIRDNVYSATTMDEDFMAPLTTEVIKSMGQEVASVVTQFRMGSYENKEFLVVDLNKGMKSEPMNVEWFKSSHTREWHGTKLSQEDWFNLLRGLQVDMKKAGLIGTTVSQNRLRKFIVDNDQKSLESFYNTNVKQLNERLAELKKWES